MTEPAIGPYRSSDGCGPEGRGRRPYALGHVPPASATAAGDPGTSAGTRVDDVPLRKGQLARPPVVRHRKEGTLTPKQAYRHEDIQGHVLYSRSAKQPDAGVPGGGGGSSR